MRSLCIPRALCGFLLALTVLPTWVLAEEEMVPLEISYPQAHFSERSIEQASRGVRLDPAAPVAPVQPVPPMVPKGTNLLSKGKPVSSSDEHPIIGELAYVTDGVKNGADGSFVEIGPGPQYVQIDLERVCRIYVVVIWHFIPDFRRYRDVVVQISEDKTFREGVTTIFNNDDDGSCGVGKGNDFEYLESRFGKLIEVEGIPGRYVRLCSNGSTAGDQNHYVEVELYGLATE